ncbi:hypothetical protein [Pseudoxanthomonas sp. UTMC 1351]|uniref:hypothetical protein n=1 Tax=Pseudoxanthomonas sp. UTMC 1351 TaxID=2695853 RepID=UPI0034CD5CD2
MIGIAAVSILLVGPLLLGLAGLIPSLRSREREIPTSSAWNSKLILLSALLYTLAFNLIFFVQEIFLVLPKALLPGVRPTLFHNNHAWEGEHPLTHLFQGTGALATFLIGVACLLLLRRGAGRSAPIRLFLVWVAYCGLFMALPQVVIGALNPGNDVGMAMDYLQLSAAAKTAAALLALVAMPVLALLLTRPLLTLAAHQGEISSAGARTRFIFQVATLPALLGIALILPFRIPRELLEVVLLPVLVTVIGIAWIQAGAWRVRTAQANGSTSNLRIVVPMGAAVLILLVFQFVLRPGIGFF